MRYIILSVLLAAVLALSGCGSKVVMTPEFVDSADTSQISSEVSAGEVSVGRPDTPPAPSSEAVPDGSSETFEEPVEPETPAVEMTVGYEEEVLWGDEFIRCTRYDMRCFVGETEAGRLTYDLIQVSGPSTEAFSTWWKNDMTEWELSVTETVRYCAEEAALTGSELQYYAVDLPAEMWVRGGVASVSRKGIQTAGGEKVAFVSNHCFEEETGRELTLWQLFTVPEEEIAPRIIEALDLQAEAEGKTGFAASSYFSPSDFSLCDGGFVFSLMTEIGIVDMVIPYENFAGILAYPIAEWQE